MILWHVILLGLVQGITEPLPISSSGHLVLLHHLLGDGLSDNAAGAREIDIAVHIGSFFAFVLCFRDDVIRLFKGGIATITGHLRDPDARLFQYLVIASVPAVIAGYFISKLDPSFFYDLRRLALVSIIFGLLLGIADKLFTRAKNIGHLTFTQALLFGLAQILALIPGVSRSGITMTAGRFLGFDRVSAAKFSFLMAMVATAGAGVLGTYDVVKSGDYSMGFDFLIAIAVSFVTTAVAVKFLMQWLTSRDFMPFVIYRVIGGGVLLLVVYLGILA